MIVNQFMNKTFKVPVDSGDRADLCSECRQEIKRVSYKRKGKKYCPACYRRIYG
jgi:formamidopyrimidine-DNA glycosylase